jgi:hypothetical protein
LPEYWELAKASPAGDGVSGFQSAFYWSATEDPFDPSFAFNVYMGDGYTYSDGKSGEYYVRCVRENS